MMLHLHIVTFGAPDGLISGLATGISGVRFADSLQELSLSEAQEPSV